jgi:hypothetical protein
MNKTAQPVESELRAAIQLAACFGVATFLLHLAVNLLQPHLGWGYFRDEFYYLMCGRHLAWGYVDHGPLVALQARLAETLFGRSLAGIRALSALGGSGRVFLTGILAWSLGARRGAQCLAMLAVALAPIYLLLDGFLSMNSCESLFWMTSLLALILLNRPSPNPRLWLLFGVSSGLGLLNKPSMAFFLAALLVALLLTPQCRLLWSGWALVGVALTLVIASPNLLWQIHNHWPTLEFLHGSQAEHAGDRPSPLRLILSQIFDLNPFSCVLWVAGLIWLLRRTQYRWIGLTYVIFMALMLALHAKDYYPTPIYPVLFAAGALAYQSRVAMAAQNRLLAFPILESAIALSGAILLPITTPIMTPAQWVWYANATHIRKALGDLNGPMPQYLADRFGWQEEVDLVGKLLQNLSPADRRHVVIFTSNYGEAGAIEFLMPAPPPIISGHNNYYLWGPKGSHGELMLSVIGADLATVRQNYARAEIVGHLTSPYAMPYEHRNIYLVHDRKEDLTTHWNDLKHYD